MKIDSLDEFLAEYTPYERIGKTYYEKAVETKNPSLLTSFTPMYTVLPANLSRSDYAPIHMGRHERFVYVPYHAHPNLELMYMYSGTCSQTIEGQSMTLGEHECCFISPSVFHTPEVYDDSILMNVIIEPEVFPQLCRDLEGVDGALTEYVKSVNYGSTYPNFFYCRTGGDDRLHSIFCSLIREYFENEKYSDFMIRSQLNEALVYIMRKFDSECTVSSQHVAKTSPVLPILRYIHDNFRSVTLGDVSEKFSYSEQHICRMIKAHTGRTFSRHIMDLRLSQAKRLLITTNMSFGEIAFYCGYDGDAYFHRLFTSEVGVTPMQYRRLNAR